MKLIALQEFPYADRSLKVGDAFEASDSDANVLKTIGKAKDDDGREAGELPIAAPKAANESPRPARTPRSPRHHRSDMRAED